MSKKQSNLLIEALKTQKEIFGDELYTKIDMNIKNIAENIEPPAINKEPEEAPVISIKLSNDYNDNEIKKPEIKLSGFDLSFQNAKTLEELDSQINSCTRCALGNTRTKFVFGKGNSNADILLVGEAPGAEEDKSGEPFVGRAGKLLTDILKAIDINREDVFIANILKCRPPNNRTPVPDEVATCIPYLKKQIDLIKPKVILCLGVTAANGLLNQKNSLIKMRGNVYEFHGVKLMVTYHPAALLRNPNWKRECWDDVQKFKKLYLELINS